MKIKKLFTAMYALMGVFCLASLAIANVSVDLLPDIANTLHVSVDTLTHYVQWFGGASGVAVATGYYPTLCDDLIPAHNCDPCAEREYGRIRSAGFIHKDFEFADGDTTNASEWTRGIDEKMIYVIPETNGEMPEPAEKVGPGYGETTETLLGYDFSAKFMDPNYSENVDFYNALIGNRNYKFFYRTSSKVHITQKTVTIIPKTQIQNDLTSEVVWGTQVKWMHSLFPVPFATPEGIFDSCYIPEEA